MPEKAFDEQCILGTSTLVCVPDKSRKGTQSLPLFFRLLFLGLINEAVLIQNDGFIAFFLLPMPPRRQRRKTHQEILHKRDPPIRQASQLGYAKQRWCGAVDNSYPLFPYSKFLHSPINAFPSHPQATLPGFASAKPKPIPFARVECDAGGGVQEWSSDAGLRSQPNSVPNDELNSTESIH